MTNYKSQAINQLTLQQKLKKLGQPISVYNELSATDAENQTWVEHIIDTILLKGYLPA